MILVFLHFASRAAGATFNYFWLRRNPGGYDMYMFVSIVDALYFCVVLIPLRDFRPSPLVSLPVKVSAVSSRLCWLLSALMVVVSTVDFSPPNLPLMCI